MKHIFHKIEITDTELYLEINSNINWHNINSGYNIFSDFIISEFRNDFEINFSDSYKYWIENRTEGSIICSLFKGRKIDSLEWFINTLERSSFFDVELKTIEIENDFSKIIDDLDKEIRKIKYELSRHKIYE